MKEFQSFTTFDLVLLVGLIGAVLVISGYILAPNIENPDHTKARESAKVIASQIMSGGLSAINEIPDKSSATRRIASVEEVVDSLGLDGRIGMDPWGKPFFFRFMRDNSGRLSHLVVWSSGPNMKSETLSLELEQSPLRFGGDDEGHISPLQ